MASKTFRLLDEGDNPHGMLGHLDAHLEDFGLTFATTLNYNKDELGDTVERIYHFSITNKQVEDLYQWYKESQKQWSL